MAQKRPRVQGGAPEGPAVDASGHVRDALDANDPTRARFWQSLDLDFYGAVNIRPPLQPLPQAQPPAPPPLGAPAGAFFKGERMTAELERRVADIEEGRVEMARYTPGEYMRHIDKILGD